MGNKKVKIFNNLENLLKIDDELTSLLAIAHGEVIEEWIYYKDHMNIAYYVQFIEESSDTLFSSIPV